MASAYSSCLTASDPLSSSSGSRRDPKASAVISTFPRRSVISSPPLVPIRRSTGGGAGAGRSAVVDRRFRVEAVVKKYKGTQMREKRLEEMIEQKVTEAQEVCEGDVRSDECKVAWDEVEEVSQAKADLRRKLAESDRDPLEPFCQENPETDECSVYED